MTTLAVGRPSSPGTEAMLRSMNMTREDLLRHSEQMRLFLTGHNHPSSNVSTPAVAQADKHRSRSRNPQSNVVSRASSVLNASARAQSPSPARVHVKAEPVEGTLLSRPLETMELVLERKSKESRERHNPNTNPRDARRMQPIFTSTPSSDATPQGTPQTPHHYRHYSDRVLGDAFPSRTLLTPVGTRDPHTPRTRGRASRRSATPGRNIYSHALTPYPPSSPMSSPARVVNMVSSPGHTQSSPARGATQKERPYVLPPGPYSEEKPECPYAALIGQAIISSPEHRLTLQDIYEWITTVYPYYKRGEQTWMNSVRHCLSTMAVFRKVPRGRNEGKSLWAIFDEDVAAFANGEFKKHLCADMVKSEKEKQAKRGLRRRGTMDDPAGRDTKRRKTNEDEATRASIPHPMLPPYFPPFHANVHHQPYYQAYTPQAIPAEVVFPPLPLNPSYPRAASRSASECPTSASDSMSGRPISAAGSVTTEASAVRGRDCSPKAIYSCPSSVPALTPNCSSSSPPSSFYASLSEDARYSSESPVCSPMIAVQASDDEQNELGATWLHTAAPIEALAPSATLLDSDDHCLLRGKSKQRDARKRYQGLSSRRMPTSSSLNRPLPTGKRATLRRESSTPPPERAHALPILPSTPPNRPCTPPRKQRVTSSGICLSPTRTPISHAGLHMSPSPSLAHYKSNLDPPPAAVFLPQAPLLSISADLQATTPPRGPSSVNAHTPLRNLSDLTSAFLNPSPLGPHTPQRLTHPTFDSPWRTPSRHVYDPHDPSALLDDELMRQNLSDMSPSNFGLGLGARPRALLYDSPTSPGSWDRFWG